MIERVVNTSSLQSYLGSMIRTDRVRVREVDNVFMIEPIKENKFSCPLLGIANGSKLTVEKFHAMSRDDKASEQ